MPSNTVVPISKEQVFSRVPQSSAPVYSTFSRDFRHLTCFDAGYLIPFMIDEVYPGDINEVSGRHLSRFVDAIRPFMDNVTLSCYYFYVPTRLIWNHFKAFMGERRRPDESISDNYQVPMLNTGNGVEVGSIFDYAGIPVGVKNLEFSALPFRAINLCYNEWFRDENLCDWLNVGGTGDAESEFGDSDDINNYHLFKRAKAHDYFTSALPFQQKGEAMSISIGKTAPVVGDGYPLGLTSTGSGANVSIYNYVQGGSSYYGVVGGFTRSPLPSNSPGSVFYPANHVQVGLSPDADKSGIIADLSNVTGFTISDFRTAMQLQALKELNARTGTRYKEIINGEWNVQISDATLDRPEFLGSYKIPFNVITVASTAETESNPQGNLSAYGLTDNGAHFAFSKGFEEHGYIIGFCCVTADQTYSQGLNRMYSRKNRYDFYTPLLANISEQAIKMKEILAQGTDVVDENGQPVDDATFGYQEAWAELRYKPNMISGKMRNGVAGTMNVWHLATQFEASEDSGHNLGIPLNSDFIEDNTDENLKRVLAVADEPQILSDNFWFVKSTRELPIYSVPAYLFGGRL